VAGAGGAAAWPFGCGPGRGTASPSLLQSIETTAGEIYAEISSYDGLVQDVAAVSPAAAAELAEVNDALHLVLMEITE